MKKRHKETIIYFAILLTILAIMLWCMTSFAWEVKKDTLYHAGQEYMILYQDDMYKVVRDSKGDYYGMWPTGSWKIEPEDLVWTIKFLIFESE